jgi:hypothetical protein
LDLSGLDTEFPESINLDVGRDKKLAAKIAEDVFLEVFCLSRSSVFNISIDR